MEWSKIKTIVIWMLVITNLFLLGLVVQEEGKAQRLEREALENTVVFLNQRGIQLDADVVPDRMELVPQQAERALEREQSLAEALVGGPVQVDALGGQMYRYTGSNGTVQLHNDGSFSVQLGASARPRKEEVVERWAKALLAKLDFDGTLLESSGDAQEGYAVLRQVWKRAPLLNHRVEVRWDEDGVRLTGRRLIGEPSAVKDQGGMTVPTALMDAFTGLNRLGDVCSQILHIQPSYVSLSTLHGSTMTLRPVWHITTDTGVYQLDTVSGQLSRSAA